MFSHNMTWTPRSVSTCYRTWHDMTWHIVFWNNRLSTDESSVFNSLLICRLCLFRVGIYSWINYLFCQQYAPSKYSLYLTVLLTISSTTNVRTMFAADGPRKKLWHESKHLRKRVAFLLEDPDLIPTDVCFRIAERNDKVEEVQGHRYVTYSLG